MTASGDARRLSSALVATATVYAIALALIVFWPDQIDRGIEWIIADLHRRVDWITYTRVEAFANTVLFVPLGFFVARLFPAASWMAIPLGFSSSLLIEVIQGAAIANRVPSLRDVVANTIGAVLGMLVAVLISKTAVRSRHRDETHPVAG